MIPANGNNCNYYKFSPSKLFHNIVPQKESPFGYCAYPLFDMMFSQQQCYKARTMDSSLMNQLTFIQAHSHGVAWMAWRGVANATPWQQDTSFLPPL